MSRFRVEHPTKPEVYAVCGHDGMIGFFVEIWDGGERPIKCLDKFVTMEPVMLITCLDFLASNGFFEGGHEGLEDALLYLRDEAPEHGTEEALKIVRVIEGFKAEDL